MDVSTITPRELAGKLGESTSYDLIDVRTPAEFGTIHACGARLMPLDRLDLKQLLASRQGRADEPVYMICKSGGRSRQACQKLQSAGFHNVVSVEGGTEAWHSAGLPVVKGTGRCLPLDRQLQIVIGSMIVIGMVLGTWVNPWCYVVAALPGPGLLMAGLTGFCPMAIVLGRMPWNQRATVGASCCTVTGA